MTEHSYIRSVHRGLSDEIYALKINTRYTNGVADCWYSGTIGDAWIEYKWISRTPKRHVPIKLSALQRRWLTERYLEGRNVAVIVACPAGAVVIRNGDWGTDTVPVPAQWLSTREVQKWLTTILLPEA